ncbi:MAG: hypothetical protein VCD00_07020 [Candidatus Hydrogenedentota bacterium]
MYRNLAIRVIIVCTIVATTSGCAMFRFGGSSSDSGFTGTTISDFERDAKLRELIDRSLRDAQRADTPGAAELVFRRPYYYREYVNYSDGVEEYDVETIASDSRITPYTAQVRLNKERFTTRFDKKKDRARSNSNFYASRGHETRSYELRHGRWRETGTLFIAEETDDTLKRDTPEFDEVLLGGGASDESKGFWNRLLFWRD